MVCILYNGGKISGNVFVVMKLFDMQKESIFISDGVLKNSWLTYHVLFYILLYFCTANRFAFPAE